VEGVAIVLVVGLGIDRAWLAPRRAEGVEWLFYDGSCGLCHRTIRLALAAAPDDKGLLFAPLASAAFKAAVPGDLKLPDSLIYVTADGAVLSRTAAVIRLLDRLGGRWRIAAGVLRVVPKPIRDIGYDAVAAIRHRVFARPSDACPLIPPDQRDRFVN